MTDIMMPQMGESIAEGTIVRWIKKVGDAIDRDEPLFEISTDKVDAEIPSPVAGVLTEIKVKEGETVAVNSVVATIGAAGEAPAAEASAGVETAGGGTVWRSAGSSGRAAGYGPDVHRRFTRACSHAGTERAGRHILRGRDPGGAQAPEIIAAGQAYRAR